MAYAAANRLVEELAEACRQHPVSEKWILAPSLRTGYQWLDAVAMTGQPVFNARVKTLTHMALELAGPLMQERGLEMVRGAGLQVLAARALAEHRKTQGGKGFLAGLRPSPGFIDALLATLRDLRLAGLFSSRLEASRFETPEKGTDISHLLALYEKTLSASGLVDYPALLSLAAQRLRSDPRALPTDLLVLAPSDLAEEWSLLERAAWEALPDESRLLLDVDRPLEPPAEGFGDIPDARLLAYLPDPPSAPQPRKDDTVKIFSAVGEINEVRGALRLCLEEGIPFDRVELLHTDPSTYLPLIFETVSRLELPEGAPFPATFAEGIPVSYSRPARALLGWLSWQRDGFLQVMLVDLVKDGLLALGDLEGAFSFSRLACLLRPLAIGEGRERYLVALDRELTDLDEQLIGHGSELGDDDPEISARRLENLRERRRALEGLRHAVASLLELTPEAPAGVALLRAAAVFLGRFARRTSSFDEYSAKRLAEAIEEMLDSLQGEEAPEGLDVLAWLEEQARGLRVMGMGPRPGCLFVQHYLAGGHSGRPYTFIVGLDDSRYPGAGLQDPLLLDRERAGLSPGLPTAAGRLTRKEKETARLLARLRGKVTLGFSCRDLADDREKFPSPAVLNAWRIISGIREGTLADLAAWLPSPTSFAPRKPERCLDALDWWLWRLCSEPSPEPAKELAARLFPHLGRGFKAVEERLSSRFTAYDGYVPAAAAECDPFSPDGPVLSASRLETLGKCPMEYFFRYVLGIEPPEEFGFDPSRWLDPTERGQLLHEAFRGFMARFIEREELPSVGKDLPALLRLVEEGIEKWKRVKPPVNLEAFENECRELKKAARLFLNQQEVLLREGRPAFLEVCMGLPSQGDPTPMDAAEPLFIELGEGRGVRARGRLDRVDELAGKERCFFIWDYKTGGDKAYDIEDPLRQGRSVQPFLYLELLRQRLRALKEEGEVKGFGYLFVSGRARRHVYRWDAETLEAGKELLSLLCDLPARGCFPFTDKGDDVKNSDFLRAFGDVAAESANLGRKLADPANVQLEAFRRLRGVKLDG